VILLLHALPLQAAMWDEQLRWFGERHRVMAPDLKGFGGSDAPAYSVESYNGEQRHWIPAEGDLQLLSTGGSTSWWAGRRRGGPRRCGWPGG
jgi:pimeloyl-ACP methyl ester carboxylesterase